MQGAWIWTFLLVGTEALRPWTPAGWLLSPFEHYDRQAQNEWVYVVQMPEGWANCGAKDDLFQFESLSIDPYPPQRNKNVTARVMGTLLEDISGKATVDYLVKFGSLPIVRDTVDACETLLEYPTLPQCPLKAGHYDISYGELLPFATPMGTYTIHAEGYVEGDEGSKRRIFCIEGQVIIRLFNPSLQTYKDDDEELLNLLNDQQ